MKDSVVKTVVLLLLLSSYNPGVSAEDITYELQSTDFLSLENTWGEISLLHNELFHNSTQLIQEYQHFMDMSPKLIELQTIGNTYFENPIHSVIISNQNNQQQKPKMFVVANHHARELITTEMAIRLTLYLLNNYGLDPSITDLLDHLELHIIPSVNVDSRDVVIHENKPWLRKNLVPFDDDNDGQYDEDGPEDVNGDGNVGCYDVYLKTFPSDQNPVYVPSSYECTYFEGIDNDGDGLVNEDHQGYTDLNRNYPTGWGEEGSDTVDPRSQIYAGTNGFSEPETQVVRDYVEAHRFTWAASLHSGINATWFPSEFGRFSNLHGSLFSDLLSVLPESYDDWLNNQQNDNHILSGEFGLWRSFMYEDRATRAPFTFELWRNASGVPYHPETSNTLVDNSTHLIMEYRGIEEFFNPNQKNIDRLFEELWPAFEYMLKSTPIIQLDLTLTTEGSKLILGYDIENTSSKFITDPIEMLIGDTSQILNIDLVSSKTGQLEIIDFEMPTDGKILVGNDYEGYLEYSIKEVRGDSSETNLNSPVNSSVFSFSLMISIPIFLSRYKKTNNI